MIQNNKILKNDILAIVIFIIMTLIFQWRNIFTNTIIGTSGDIVLGNVSASYWFGNAIAKGVFPFWMPEMYSGIPWFAVFGSLNPFMWLSTLFGDIGGYKASFALVGISSAYFTYKYLCNLKFDFTSCVIGGCLFAFSGSTVIRYGHMMFIHTYAWLPLILMYIDKWRETGNKKYIAYCSFASLLCYMCGAIQIFVYMYIFITLYTLMSISKTKKNNLKFLLGYVAIILLTIVLVSVHFLSAFELSRYGVRNPGSAAMWDTFVSYPLSPIALLTSVFPFIFSGIDGNSFYAPASLGNMSDFYIGIFPLYFAIIAIYNLFRRKTEVRIYVVLSTMTVLFATASFTPIGEILFKIPIYNSFRASSRWHFALSFSTIVLSAYGVNLVINNMKDKIKLKKLLQVPTLVFSSTIALILIILKIIKDNPRSFFAEGTSLFSFFAGLRLKNTYTLLSVLLVIACIVVYLFLVRKNISKKIIIITTLIILLDNIIYTNTIYEKYYNNVNVSELEYEDEMEKYLRQNNKDESRVATFGWCPIGTQPGSNLINDMELVNGYSGLALDEYVNGLFRSQPEYLVYMIPNSMNKADNSLDITNGKYLLVSNGYMELPIETINGMLFRGKKSFKVDENSSEKYSIFNPNEAAIDTFAMISYSEIEGEIDANEQYTVIIHDKINMEKIIKINTKEYIPENLYEIDGVTIRCSETDITIGENEKARGKMIEVQFHENIVPSDIEIENEHGTFNHVQSVLFSSESKTTIGINALDYGNGFQEDYKLLLTSGGYTLFENLDVFKRVWPVGTIKEYDDEIEMYKTIHGDEAPDNMIDMSNTALMLKTDVVKYGLAGYENRDRVTVEFQRNSANSFSLKTDNEKDVFVVVSDTYFSGWSATADGKSIPIINVDGVLKGVLVPSGTHIVKFVYIPQYFYLGLIITTFGFLICAILIYTSRKKSDINLPCSEV